MAWDEIDGNVWTIPAAKMKMRRGHRIHLSRQVLAILAELRETATGPFVFTNGNKPLSTKTLNRALRVLGYSSDVMVAHGFRSTASTLLNAECRWPKDIIEIQLAHGDEDRIRATYNRLSEFDAIMSQNADDKIVDRLWEIRVKMMQHWSDQLDALAGQTGVVVQLRKVA
jgi:integrase